ncbi:MAG TPA: hypothetical protein VN577_22030 [Terriglobales bacterium]|nr:hypothetical protein [Terriglobales bacterium]
MRHIKTFAFLALIALVFAVIAVAQNTSNQQQNQSMQGMQGMHGQMQHSGNDQMHGMMADCHKNMQAMQQSNTQARQNIAAAKQSNDPAKMRAALDEADKALANVNDHMDKCMSMMKTMRSKHGDGMMKGEQNQPPKK